MELTARVYMKTSKDGIEYVRIIAPKELQAHLAKPAVWRSLKTSDRNEALEEAAICVVATQNLMQEFANEFFADFTPTVKITNEIQDEQLQKLIDHIDNSLTEEFIRDLKDSFTSKVKRDVKTREVKNKIETAIQVSKRKREFLKRLRDKRRKLKNRNRA